MSFKDRVRALKEKNDSVLVAHNYQRDIIQESADYVGDSFGLAKIVGELDVKNVIFCGVDFMAESAVILNPDKNIIHPEPQARCPMAAMVDIEVLQEYKKDHADTAVVSYVNTNVETKAESDICCTSSNAVKVVESLEENEILFLPDKNLGHYIKRFVKDKEITLWEGYCATHDKISLGDILELKESFPDAEIAVHPECRPEVVDAADYVGSTAGILQRAKESSAKRMIIGTEVDMGYRLRQEVPSKDFFFPKDPYCSNMKKITPEKVICAMENLEPKVEIDSKLAAKAKIPLERMINIGRGN